MPVDDELARLPLDARGHGHEVPGGGSLRGPRTRGMGQSGGHREDGRRARSRRQLHAALLRGRAGRVDTPMGGE